MKDVCQNNFKLSIDKVLGHLTMSGTVKDDHIRSLFFGDYMNPEGERIYDEIGDIKELTKVMEQWVVTPWLRTRIDLRFPKIDKGLPLPILGFSHNSDVRNTSFMGDFATHSIQQSMRRQWTSTIVMLLLRPILLWRTPAKLLFTNSKHRELEIR